MTEKEKRTSKSPLHRLLSVSKVCQFLMNCYENRILQSLCCYKERFTIRTNELNFGSIEGYVCIFGCAWPPTPREAEATLELILLWFYRILTERLMNLKAFSHNEPLKSVYGGNVDPACNVLSQGHRSVLVRFSATGKSAKSKDLSSIKTHKHIFTSWEEAGWSQPSKNGGQSHPC